VEIFAGHDKARRLEGELNVSQGFTLLRLTAHQWIAPDKTEEGGGFRTCDGCLVAVDTKH
jgi:hypothetical protein